MCQEDFELVRGSGNVFRDRGYVPSFALTIPPTSRETDHKLKDKTMFREHDTDLSVEGGPKAPIEWFDDLAIGMRFKSAEVQITADEIKRFAAQFDPQPMHLDEHAAEKTLFKGLAASGWHTSAIAMNLAVQTRPFGPHPLIGMGVDELRWPMPVRAGDVLHLEGEIVGLTPSRTKPQGVALVKWTLYNQNGEAVYTFTPIGIVPRRPQHRQA